MKVSIQGNASTKKKKKDNTIFEEGGEGAINQSKRITVSLYTVLMDHYWHEASNSDATLWNISTHEKYREERED